MSNPWQFIPDHILDAEKLKQQAESWASEQRANLTETWANTQRSLMPKITLGQEPAGQPVPMADYKPAYEPTAADVSGEARPTPAGERQATSLGDIVGHTLERAGRPQQSAFGAITESSIPGGSIGDIFGGGLSGAKRGLLGEQRQTGYDVVKKLGGTGNEFLDKALGLGTDLTIDPTLYVGKWRGALQLVRKGTELAPKLGKVAGTVGRAIESPETQRAVRAIAPGLGIEDINVLRLDQLPTVKEGMIRLYRGESSETTQLPSWISEQRKSSGIEDATNRWWTNDVEKAKWYVEDPIKARMRYIDIPEEVASQYHLGNLSQSNANILEARKFSKDPGSEYFLPKELAAGGHVVPTYSLGVQAVEESPVKRYYHGTVTTFDKPEPGMFDPNGLYGPGYYMTDSPVVAASYSEKGKKILPSLDELERAKATTQDRVKFYEQEIKIPSLATYTTDEAQKKLSMWQDELSGIERQIAQAKSGPQVRVVNVPSNVKLLNAESQAPEELLKALDNRMQDWGWTYDTYQEALPAYPTGHDVYRALAKASESDPEWVNMQLQSVGYDGIKYQGGKRMPIKDSAGNPIQHEAVAVFPESLNKIKNAFSGREGGQALAGPAVRLGTTALGATTGAVSAYDPNKPLSEQNYPEMAQRAVAGGVAGYLGGTGLEHLAESSSTQGLLRRLAKATDSTLTDVELRKIVPGGTVEDVSDKGLVHSDVGVSLAKTGDVIPHDPTIEGFSRDIPALTPEELKAQGERLRNQFSRTEGVGTTETYHVSEDIKKILPKRLDQDALFLYHELQNNPGKPKLIGDLLGGKAITNMTPERMAKAQELLNNLKPYQKEIDRALQGGSGMEQANALLDEYFAGRMARGKSLGYIKGEIPDYMPHILERKKSGFVSLSNAPDITKGFEFGQKRSYPDILTAIMAGEKPRSINAADVLRFYGGKEANAYARNELLNSIKQAVSNGDWVVPEGMTNAVPKQIYDALKPVLDPDHLKEIGGIRKWRWAQAWAKSVEVSLSMFHARQLNLVGLNRVGPQGIIKAKGLDKTSPWFREKELSLVNHSGTTITSGQEGSSYRVFSTPPKRGAVDPRRLTDAFDSLAGAIQGLTFGDIQRKFKVFDYAQGEAGYLAKHPDATPEQLDKFLTQQAQTINAVYGGLNWNEMGVTKSNQTLLRLLLLAPDWTFSNLYLPWKMSKGIAGKLGEVDPGIRKLDTAKFFAYSVLTGVALTQGMNLLLHGKLSDDPFNVTLSENPDGSKTKANMFIAGDIKDIVQWFNYMSKEGVLGGTLHSAVSKAAPGVGTIAGELTNTDVFGRKIRQPAMTQIEKDIATVEHIAGGLPIPIGIATAAGLYRKGQEPSPVEAALSITGMGQISHTAAPKGGASSPLQKYLGGSKPAPIIPSAAPAKKQRKSATPALQRYLGR